MGMLSFGLEVKSLNVDLMMALGEKSEDHERCLSCEKNMNLMTIHPIVAKDHHVSLNTSIADISFIMKHLMVTFCSSTSTEYNEL